MDSQSISALISSATGITSGSLIDKANLLDQLRSVSTVKDSVDVSGATVAKTPEETEAAEKAQRENFTKAFTPEISAAVFGLDASKLTEQQSADLTEFLFNIDQENYKREQAGEEPLSKDELNQYIKEQIAEFKESSAGKTEGTSSDKAGKKAADLESAVQEVTGSAADAIRKLLGVESKEDVDETSEAAEGEEAADSEEVVKSTLGQTLSELGITELSDEQMSQIEKSLEQYLNGEEITAVDDAKAAAKAKAEEEAKKAQEANQAAANQAAANQAANNAGNSGSSGGSSGGSNGGGSVGSSGGSGRTGSSGSAGRSGSSNGASSAASSAASQSPAAAGAGSSNVPDMAEDLDGLQQQKADAQSKVGNLDSQIDAKKSEINQRKADVAKGVGTEGLDEKQAAQQEKTQAEYEKAQTEFEKAQTEKTKIQADTDKNTQAMAENTQALYAKSEEKSAKTEEVSAAKDELGSLEEPTAPSGDDPEAQAAYESARGEYNTQKAQLESKVKQLESEERQLETEITKLQEKGDELEAKQTEYQEKMATQDQAMDKAQATMDKKMEELQKNNPAIETALAEDEVLQTIQGEVEALESQKTEQESFITNVDAQIAAKEQENTAVQSMRQQEAENDFRTALADAGNPTLSATEKEQLEDLDAAKEDYNAAELQAKLSETRSEYLGDNPLDELIHTGALNKSDIAGDKIDEIEAKLDVNEAANTAEAMEWAQEQLMLNPNDEKAQAILDTGNRFLEQKEAGTYNKALEAVQNLPDGVKDGANAYIKEAVAAADEAGTDTDIAAKQAIAEYSQNLLANGDLSDEDRALVETAAQATAKNVEDAEALADGKASAREAEFYKQIEEMPEGVRDQAYALRDSVEALSRPGAGYAVQDTIADITEYYEANPEADLDMQTAKSMFGDFGPVALAALQDNTDNAAVSSKLLGDENNPTFAYPEPLDTSSGLSLDPFDSFLQPLSPKQNASFTGDISELYHAALVSTANNEVADFADDCLAVAAENPYMTPDQQQAITKKLAENAAGWQELSATASEGIQRTDGTQAAKLGVATMSQAAMDAAAAELANTGAVSGMSVDELMNTTTEFGTKLAEASLAYCNSNTNEAGWCKRGVRIALEQMGLSLPGEHAFQATQYLDQMEEFVRCDEVPKDRLAELPAGAIVVFASGNGAGGNYSGHIFISQGNGVETSDKQWNINPNNYGDNYTVYFPSGK